MYRVKLTPCKRERAVLGVSMLLSPPPRCHFPVPVVVIVSATSPCHPWPSCSPFPPCKQLLATAVGGPVLVVEVMAILALTFPLSSWSSHNWVCWVVACPSIVVFLPAVVVIAGVPTSSFDHAAPCLHPTSSFSQQRLAFVVLSFHP